MFPPHLSLVHPVPPVPTAPSIKAYNDELQRRLGRQISTGPMYAPPQLAAQQQQQGRHGAAPAPGPPPPLLRVAPWQGPALAYAPVDIPAPTDAPAMSVGDPDAAWRPQRRKAVLVGAPR